MKRVLPSRWLTLAANAVFAAGCAHSPRNVAAPAVPPDLDHVVMAVTDFTRGVAALEAATGASLDSDWTPTLGTSGADVGGTGVRAAFLALADGRFVELVGPAPDGSAVPSLASIFSPYSTPTPIGWAVRTGNADSLRGVLAERALRPGSLRNGALTAANGERHSYRAVEGWPGITTLMPFFVEWMTPRTAPMSGRPPQCTLERLVLDYYAPDSLATRIATASVRVLVAYGSAQTQGIRITLRCPDRTVEFPLHAS
jgi:Glyoxalase-like domain